MNKAVMALVCGAALVACNSADKKPETGKEAPIIGKATVKVENGIMTPEVLYSFGRVTDVQVSPDKSKILYGVTYVSIEQNKTNRELFTMNIDGSEKKQITNTAKSENNAVWIKGGAKIAFLSSESGSSQIWEMNADGTGRKQVSAIEGDINGFTYSPDEKKIMYIKNIKFGERTADRYPDLPNASGRIIDDLMYKHWSEWIEEIPHTFIADYDGNKMADTAIDILGDEPYECPMLPFGGTEQLAWSPDSKSVAYTCRKKTGVEYSLSTNSDIYLYNLESKETKNLTEGMMGYDTNPVFSPDGKYIAWQSMERDGYESDKNRMFVMNLATSEKIYVTEKFDYNTDYLAWNDDNQSIYFVSCVEAKTHLFKAFFHTNEITQITKGDYDYESFGIAGDKLIALRHSMSMPNEIYAVNTANGEAKELSFENKEILSQLTMGKVEERWIPTTDGKKMLTWVVYPPNFDPNKKYPTLLYCQGGPQSTVSQFWSYRWNLQMMAANDYIIVAPNRRGLPGFGQEWLEQISKDYGGQNMKDYLSAIDALAKEPYVNADKLGCTGASYGGFSVYWLAGNHNKRFKAFLSHAGIFNLEAQYLETEEMWFANWDLGGSFWDRSNSIAQRSYANSPHRFVDKWDTPIMVTHGELDFRILASQGMMAFNAAKLKGIPARMLVYPNENHWISQPQNGVLFQREFFRWFDTYLK
ncbi:dipeptidyl aminopeptidase/acylaminoacyl peptidase [Dysgonomonas sp. PFB1-18]|uniref:S9 family peptidase n=1 Tax=unclassified Dysgonomonas TaxID=2630389 RepID=UPI002472F7AB|nr:MULTISPECIES: S9 family peptidase [unclassified Dysgonomonas]MDH6310552.1 dipeptidyl aminopeptidase/acylaminoacyl peptidase [Dysgonomonas sp. PF1-14]MDH6340402.1 dipeptidyl aminopeptidase/acylaminoacyl peptidase [Dysgonomonas sp. PF1-16]MDH6382018.1 dipeptidyl aminopeptidase/acylaminoacyl peptidase [Dysgonomonas sp. PFB1-18]MDH6399373.1 dipeptidyl aminopeptidase/acylaminoacyl peptidase [Dysgonomonas sp. PF1-23]